MTRRTRAISSIYFVLVMALSAGAATYRHMSLDALVQASDLIIYGKVISSHSQLDSATGAIWTSTEICVLDGPKGQAGTSVTVTEPGGIVGRTGELYPGVPRFRADQELILFLYRAPGNRLRITGLQQGVFAVITDRQTGERLALPTVSQADVVYEEGSRAAKTATASNPGMEKLSRFLYAIRQKASKR